MQDISNTTNGNANAPRDSISWYQSVACSRWLNARLRATSLLPDDDLVVRLPTEYEWQWAAQYGTDEREYPWGAWDEHPRANTTEAGIQDRSTAVGIYLHGKAICGAFDMTGNLWEWCLNDYRTPTNMDLNNANRRVLRGGAFHGNQLHARCAFRHNPLPFNRLNIYGVRFLCGIPVGWHL